MEEAIGECPHLHLRERNGGRRNGRSTRHCLRSSSAIINMLFFLEAEDDASLASAGALTGRIMCASLTRMTISGFSLHLPHKWERRPTAGSQPDSSFSGFLRSFEVVSSIAALVSSFTQSSPVRKRQPARPPSTCLRGASGMAIGKWGV